MDRVALATDPEAAVYAIVAAAGGSTRMKGVVGSKLFFEILPDQSVILLTLRTLLACDFLRGIFIAHRLEDRDRLRRMLDRAGFTGKVHLIPGGESRQESVARALASVPSDADLVLVHDGARPFCPPRLVLEVVEAARAYGASVAAIPVTSTLKPGEGSFVGQTWPRENIWAAQTPQCFRVQALREAHHRARSEGFFATDDSELVERIGGDIRLVMGTPTNIKITAPGDLLLAQALAKVMHENRAQLE